MSDDMNMRRTAGTGKKLALQHGFFLWTNRGVTVRQAGDDNSFVTRFRRVGPDVDNLRAKAEISAPANRILTN